MPFSLFPDKNNIAKLVGDIEEIVSTDCVSYCIQMNMHFKSSRSQMFYKLDVLKNFAKFR